MKKKIIFLSVMLTIMLSPLTYAKEMEISPVIDMKNGPEIMSFKAYVNRYENAKRYEFTIEKEDEKPYKTIGYIAENHIYLKEDEAYSIIDRKKAPLDEDDKYLMYSDEIVNHEEPEEGEKEELKHIYLDKEKSVRFYINKLRMLSTHGAKGFSLPGKKDQVYISLKSLIDDLNMNVQGKINNGAEDEDDLIYKIAYTPSTKTIKITKMKGQVDPEFKKYRENKLKINREKFEIEESRSNCYFILNQIREKHGYLQLKLSPVLNYISQYRNKYLEDKDLTDPGIKLLYQDIMRLGYPTNVAEEFRIELPEDKLSGENILKTGVIDALMDEKYKDYSEMGIDIIRKGKNFIIIIIIADPYSKPIIYV